MATINLSAIVTTYDGGRDPEIILCLHEEAPQILLDERYKQTWMFHEYESKEEGLNEARKEGETDEQVITRVYEDRRYGDAHPTVIEAAVSITLTETLRNRLSVKEAE